MKGGLDYQDLGDLDDFKSSSDEYDEALQAALKSIQRSKKVTKSKKGSSVAVEESTDEDYEIEQRKPKKICIASGLLRRRPQGSLKCD